MFAEDIVADTRTPLAPCVHGPGPHGQSEWQVPAGETACFAAPFDRDGSETPDPLDDMSVDDGFNLEFRIVRAGPTEPGTTLSLACQPSADQKKDCPNP